MQGISVGQTSVITAGPTMNLWRGPISNDGVKGKAEQWSADWKPLGRWCNAGLDQLKRTRAEPPSLQQHRDGSASVSLKHVWTCRGKDKQTYQLTHDQTIRVGRDGSLQFDHAFDLDRRLPDLPRVGVLLSLADGFERLAWHGRGPQESYPDRKTAAAMGWYRSTVAEQYVPYILPQEHGLKTDVRWFELLAQGVSLRVDAESADRPLLFSASRFTPQDLTKAYHTYDMTPRDEVTVCLDAAHRGLGTASCGPDTLEPYKVPPGQYRLRYSMKVFRRDES